MATVLSAAAVQAAPLPDLVEVSVTNPPTAVGAGTGFTIADKVKNRGGARARSSATGYYLSLDSTRSAGDIRLGRRSVPELRIDHASSGQRAVTVPTDTPLQRYFVLACADDRKVVKEGKEGNNCRSSGTRVRVRAPTCQEQLGILSIDFDDAPDTQGVDDPVTVHPPINGIDFDRAGGSSNADILMDCSWGLKMHEMAEGLPALGIDTVSHFGVYNYRFIGGTNTLSEHAYGRALDIAGLSGDAGTFTVLDDWVPGDAATTCTAPEGTPEHEFLRDLVCSWAASDLFHIILTPNYNAAHADHFHVDITPGADYIN